MLPEILLPTSSDFVFSQKNSENWEKIIMFTVNAADQFASMGKWSQQIFPSLIEM